MNYIEFFVDLFVPRQNLEFSSISTYLTDEEINNLDYKYKILDTDQVQYIEKILICSSFQNKTIQDLIDRVKFFGQWSISKDFAKLIWNRIGRENLKPDLFIPVPPDPKRLSDRGYHLPAEICSELEQISQILIANILLKTKTTVQQSLLDKQKRLVNLKGKFQLVEQSELNLAKFTNIFLVDDLTTTGTTLLECAKVLKKNYPFLKIYGIVVAGN